MLGRRRFHDPLAGPASKPGPVCDNYPVLGRDHVEPLGSLFADHMHRLLAARAIRVGRRDRRVNARQMGGQCAAVEPPFPRCSGNLRLLLDCLGLGDRLLDVFQRQIELIGMKLGQPLAFRFEALRLAQQMAQAVVEFDQPVPLGNCRIALGDGVQRQRPQRINIVGKRINWSGHAPSTAHRRRFARSKLAPDSLYRRLLHRVWRRHKPRPNAHPV